MIALVIVTRRKDLPELYRFLDLHDREWRFYNLYDNEAADESRHTRIRCANMGFVHQSQKEGTEDFSASTTIVTTPSCAMVARLTWTVETIVDLRGRGENVKEIV